jgi:histone-lysine N-methyltransferase SETD1
MAKCPIKVLDSCFVSVKMLKFFGFGVDFVRNALESSSSAVACAVPLTPSSCQYQFCFQNPTSEAVMELQRKRAAIRAERALENISGCARTEGSSAFDKSKGSGRITRALVRKTDDENLRRSSLAKGAELGKAGQDSLREFESIQAKYREMKSVPMEERLAAKRSHIHGWGLFAKKDFSANSMIAEYMGEAISQPIADKREKKYEVLGMGSCYMFRLDFHEIVDATSIGCMARFMNHCCAANAYAKVISVNTDKGLEKKIVVFANQEIKMGDEITYDYKFPVEDGSLRCTCGAHNCIGRMN